MPAEENKEVVCRFVEEDHDPTAPSVPSGPEGVKRLVGMYRFAFPGTRFEMGEMICERDTVALR